MKKLTKEQIKHIKILQNEYKHNTNKNSFELNSIEDKIITFMLDNIASDMKKDFSLNLFKKINNTTVYDILINKFMNLGVVNNGKNTI